ncbi:MAG: hypothetical protein BAJALOKI1v1_810007 [Promethearchaeota archaeon]|nr:MAG: hypothetical protein BAJALOKI1v1_810007 [Candidatus Lokiarchaeota archaeon]
MIGELPRNILNSMLQTIPMEFSVLDKNDKVLAWNKHDTRIFKRPKGVVGKDVRNCHPQKSLHKVEQILTEFKDGSRDKARFWIDLNLEGKDASQSQKILIEYYALRDTEGVYLGCVEITQNITELQSITGEKRLLD